MNFNSFKYFTEAFPQVVAPYCKCVFYRPPTTDDRRAFKFRYIKSVR